MNNGPSISSTAFCRLYRLINNAPDPVQRGYVVFFQIPPDALYDLHRGIRVIALVNKNWTLKLYFFAYNPQLLYGCICFPVLFGRQISQCVCWPFLVEKFYICLHLFWNVFALQMKICKQF